MRNYKVSLSCSDYEIFKFKYRFLFLLLELRRIGIDVTLIIDSESQIDVETDLQEADLNNLLSVVRPYKMVRQLKDFNQFMDFTRDSIKNLTVRDFPLWKLLLLDDWAGSFSPDYFSLEENFNVFLFPLYSCANTYKFLTLWHLQAFYLCRKKHIPLIGIEISTLDKKYPFNLHLFDFFVLKNSDSKQFLEKCLGINSDRIFLLRSKYRNILSKTVATSVSQLLTLREAFFALPSIFDSKFTITLVHDFRERYSFRQLLRLLAKLNKDYDFNVVIISDPNKSALFLSEKEAVQEAYQFELSRIKNLAILETYRKDFEFLSLYSDIVIYVTPYDISDSFLKKDNVIFFNCQSLHFYPYLKCISNINDLKIFIQNFFNKENKFYTFSSAFKRATETFYD